LNYNVEVLQPILNQIPADGGSVDFSLNELADKAMKEGEAAFARGDQSKARSAYLRALQLEPTLYEAAVFIADTYFQKKQWTQADEWYARAVAIDPDRDTAYRYWSDSLLRQGQMDESRAKAIDAIIAEPYKEISWNGLIQWARGNGVGLSHPRIESPIKAERGKQKTDINISPETLESKGGAGNWLYYEMARMAWTTERFVKEFPNETVYRHSLREEAEALRTVAEAAAKDLKSGKVKVLDESLAYLVKLNEDGLLEAYVLLARADEGISRDYLAYREPNRDRLRRYLAEYVVQSK
jgi:tetratricopeptide (TPR) repeat protein